MANATARVVRHGHGELRTFVLGADTSDQWGYTVDEVAAILKVSKHTVLRRAKELGAVQIAGNEGSIKVRRYRVLRFPRVALEKYLTKLTGHPVVLSSLTIPQTRRARADWEETATRKLAEIASANSKRAVFARIAGTLARCVLSTGKSGKMLNLWKVRTSRRSSTERTLNAFRQYVLPFHGSLARRKTSEGVRGTEP